MAETQTPLVSIYNRSDRSFIHGKFIVSPRTFSDVPAEVSALLIKNYPADIVERGVAVKELNGVHAELAEVRTQLAAAEARVKELEAAAAPKGRGKSSASADV